MRVGIKRRRSKQEIEDTRLEEELREQEIQNKLLKYKDMEKQLEDYEKYKSLTAQA